MSTNLQFKYRGFFFSSQILHFKNSLTTKHFISKIQRLHSLKNSHDNQSHKYNNVEAFLDIKQTTMDLHYVVLRKNTFKKRV
jgi:hypothetical protein